MQTAEQTRQQTGSETVGHLINGEVVISGGPTQPVYNPATGQVIRQVEMADQATVEQAIAAAEAAFPAWRATTPAKRARIMFRFKQLLEERADEICRLLTEEHGKVFADSMGELQRGIENVEFACYAPETLKGEHSRDVGPGVDSWSEFQPLGVVAGTRSWCRCGCTRRRWSPATPSCSSRPRRIRPRHCSCRSC
jgi:malonate-semialdehyde dehydrogenase (acetylating)/methylmalonate-semialdehyde dehydrogenase